MNNDLKKQQNTPAQGQGAGSEYNEAHAGQLPDYGKNEIDPNAVNASDNTEMLYGMNDPDGEVK